MRREGVGLRTKKGNVWSWAFVDDVATPTNQEGGAQRGTPWPGNTGACPVSPLPRQASPNQN
eukprot:1224281-Rhodomonas_salina.1